MASTRLDRLLGVPQVMVFWNVEELPR